MEEKIINPDVEDGEQKTVAEKTYTQAEVDELIRKKQDEFNFSVQKKVSKFKQREQSLLRAEEESKEKDEIINSLMKFKIDSERRDIKAKTKEDILTILEKEYDGVRKFGDLVDALIVTDDGYDDDGRQTVGLNEDLTKANVNKIRAMIRNLKEDVTHRILGEHSVMPKDSGYHTLKTKKIDNVSDFWKSNPEEAAELFTAHKEIKIK